MLTRRYRAHQIAEAMEANMQNMSANMPEVHLPNPLPEVTEPIVVPLILPPSPPPPPLFIPPPPPPLPR